MDSYFYVPVLFGHFFLVAVPLVGVNGGECMEDGSVMPCNDGKSECVIDNDDNHVCQCKKQYTLNTEDLSCSK